MANPAPAAPDDDEALPAPLRLASRTEVWSGRRRLTYFGGCDYLRLASDPRVIAAAVHAARTHGLGVSASRRTTGNHPLYEQLERTLADYFRAPACRLVSTGYVTNLAVAQALAGEFTHVLVDAGAHPSLQDAALLSGSRRVVFRAGDADDAIRQQRKLPARARTLLLTDGVNPTSGAAAPLKELRAGLRPETWLLVDDCHGFGTVGPTGRGTVELSDLGPDRLIQTGTLSKAFGAFGGFILGDSALIGRLTHSRIFLGSTPPPLPLAAAALKSLQLLAASPGRLQRLQRNVALVKAALHAAGRLEAITPGPICRIVPRSSDEQARLRQRLLQAGIFPSYLHYPGLPAGGAFRFALSSEHTARQVGDLIRSLTGATR